MGFGPTINLPDLLEERTRLEIEVGQVKGRLSQVNQAIAEAVEPQVIAAFERLGKPDGTAKFLLGNTMFKAVISKRVDWNSDALKDIAGEISPVLAANLFKTVYSVPEANFKAVLDPLLRAKLIVARSVRYDPPKITLADDEKV